MQNAARFDTIDARHFDVHEDDIRLEGFGLRNGLFPARCLSDHLNIRGEIQHLADAVTKEWMFIKRGSFSSKWGERILSCITRNRADVEDLNLPTVLVTGTGKIPIESITIDKGFRLNDNHVMGKLAPKSKKSAPLSLSFISAALVVIYLCYFSTSPAIAQTSPAIYWGVVAGGEQYGTGNAPFDMTTLDIFESNVGKKVSIVRWGAPWKYQGNWLYFQTNEMNKVRAHGSIPLLDWGSWALGSGQSMSNQPNFRNADVASGIYDSFIRRWADQAQAWGYPFFLRYNFEANGWWYSFQEGRLADGSIINGNHAGDYIRDWRHVWNVFNCLDDGVFHPSPTCQPVTNATWVWTINIISSEIAIDGQPRYPELSQVYPGDQYVDWVGVSLYNTYISPYSFSSLFTGAGTIWLKNTYQLLADVAPTKPMMIAELGSNEYYNDPTIKANWITDAIGTQIPRKFPRIKAILWSNGTDEFGSSGTIIETSPDAEAAFKNAIANPVYSANTFGNLFLGTKVQPLGALTDTIGVFRPSNGVIFLKNTNRTGFADVALNYGIPGDKPVTGDWNGDGTDTIGVYRNGIFYLRNSNTVGFADIIYSLGNSGDMPIAGNWDGLP